MSTGPPRRLDPPALYSALDRARLARGLTWQQLSEETGVSVATAHRLRRHGRFEADGIIALTAWLGQARSSSCSRASNSSGLPHRMRVGEFKVKTRGVVTDATGQDWTMRAFMKFREVFGAEDVQVRNECVKLTAL